MEGYLLFVPNPEATSDSMALSWAGLSDLAGSHDSSRFLTQSRPIPKGPGETGGVLFAVTRAKIDFETAANVLDYRPDFQTWEPAKQLTKDGRAKFWLGRLKGMRTDPEDLRRPRQFESVPVYMDDGNEWSIPLIRDLPRRIELDGEAQPVKTVRDEYADHFQLGRKFYETFIAMTKKEQPADDLSVRDAYHFVARGLRMNYAVTAPILDLLGVIRDDETLMYAAGCAVEYPLMKEMADEKKKTAPIR